MSRSLKTPALAAAITGSLMLAGSAFASTPLTQGYMLSAADAPAKTDAKAGEMKCGADKAKAGEMKCGADKAKAREMKCGADKAKAGEMSCGADKAKAKPVTDKKVADAKMAEGKCGEGKCGGSI
ncbi:HvfA family oxazolone/thioamide-modified RiPP metallophore [Lysobacter xanthus]